MNMKRIYLYKRDRSKVLERFKKFLSRIRQGINFVDKTFGVVMDDELLHAALTHYDYFAARLRSLSTTGSDKLDDWLSTAKDRYFYAYRVKNIHVLPHIERKGNKLVVLIDDDLAERIFSLSDIYVDMENEEEKKLYKHLKNLEAAINFLIRKEPDLLGRAIVQGNKVFMDAIYFEGNTAKIDPTYFQRFYRARREGEYDDFDSTHIREYCP